MQLNLGGNDLALEPRSGFDGALGLLLEDDGSVLLLKPAQGLLRRVKVDTGSRELARQERSLAPRLARPVLRDELIEELDVVIGHGGS